VEYGGLNYFTGKRRALFPTGVLGQHDGGAHPGAVVAPAVARSVGHPVLTPDRTRIPLVPS
jgi:hypothetical protein